MTETPVFIRNAFIVILLALLCIVIASHIDINHQLQQQRDSCAREPRAAYFLSHQNTYITTQESQ